MNICMGMGEKIYIQLKNKRKAIEWSCDQSP